MCIVIYKNSSSAVSHRPEMVRNDIHCGAKVMLKQQQQQRKMTQQLK